MNITFDNVKTAEDVSNIISTLKSLDIKDFVLETNIFDKINSGLINPDYSNGFKLINQSLKKIEDNPSLANEIKLTYSCQQLLDLDEGIKIYHIVGDIEKSLLGLLQIGLLKNVTIKLNYIQSNI